MEQNTSTGKLYLILSQMFGGKTSYLMHIMEVSSYVTKVLYINHSLDTRTKDNESYSTHSKIITGGKLENVDLLQVPDLSLVGNIDTYGVICVDEGQFFSDLSLVRYWVECLGKDVYVASLSGDYKRNNFGKVHTLLPLADNVILLRDTYCPGCKKEKALFTHLIDKSVFEKEKESDQIFVGGQAEYIPLCRKCYCENNN